MLLTANVIFNNMIEHIEKYLSIQESIVRELKKRSIDLWSCNEPDVLGWECDSHGDDSMTFVVVFNT